MASIVSNLYHYNDWAHAKLFGLCQGLSDEQLDQPRPLGFGSLRATLFHILTAERVWLERWNQVPWRPFPTDPQGIPLAEMAAGLAEVAGQRAELMAREEANQWQRVVSYLDSKQNSYSNRLQDLLIHVANHGVYHRAQALHFLKQFGRTLPGGLDYIFFRMAHPVVEQTAEATAAMKGFGLEIASSPGEQVTWDGPLIADYFAYHDWANQQLLEQASQLTDEQLDHSYEMGPGTIRKTLLHLHDAEAWWNRNWTEGPQPFPRSPAELPVKELTDLWHTTAERRNEFLSTVTAETAHRTVTVLAGGPPTSFQIIESAVQLCCHGTHHRAQLSNMLRQSGVTPPGLDYVVWLRR